jgi:hypothetical protein
MLNHDADMMKGGVNNNNNNNDDDDDDDGSPWDNADIRAAGGQ